MSFNERYFNAWKSVWDLHKRYDGTSINDDENWNRLLDEARNLKQQFKGCPEEEFAKSLILATCTEIERRSKENATTK